MREGKENAQNGLERERNKTTKYMARPHCRIRFCRLHGADKGQRKIEGLSGRLHPVEGEPSLIQVFRYILHCLNKKKRSSIIVTVFVITCRCVLTVSLASANTVYGMLKFLQIHLFVLQGRSLHLINFSTSCGNIATSLGTVVGV